MNEDQVVKNQGKETDCPMTIAKTSHSQYNSAEFVNITSKLQTSLERTRYEEQQIDISCQKIEKTEAKLEISQHSRNSPKLKKQLGGLPSINDSTLILLVIGQLAQKIWKNKTQRCNYIQFHILFCFACSYVLSRLPENAQNTFYYQLFSLSIKKINQINNTEPNQLNPSLVYQVVTDCLTFYKHKEDSAHYLRQLASFLEQHQSQIASFMPLYYAYFYTIAHFQEVFVMDATIPEVLTHLKRLQQEAREKYHRVDL